jgi:hypothetical protein
MTIPNMFSNVLYIYIIMGEFLEICSSYSSLNMGQLLIPIMNKITKEVGIPSSFIIFYFFFAKTI